MLSSSLAHGPSGRGIGINQGLHFTGGEPFLKFNLLLRLVRIAAGLGIEGTFVETNCFRCTNPEATWDKLNQLKECGLRGMLVSVNPFTLEYVPLERPLIALREAKKVFGRNVLVYQETFLRKILEAGIRGRNPLDRTLEILGTNNLGELELLPKGRAPYQLEALYRKYPARAFFRSSCGSELTRGWHFHIDNYFNYLPGYCGGISLGDARDMDSIRSGVDLDDHPILDLLVGGLGRLYDFAVEEFHYSERPEGYVSKCHLCLDMRKYISEQTNEFRELSPGEFYQRL